MWDISISFLYEKKIISYWNSSWKVLIYANFINWYNISIMRTVKSNLINF